MADFPSKSLVHQPGAPIRRVDYRFDLTRRAVAAFAVAGIAVACLIFLTGLVLGVQVNLGTSAAGVTKTDAAPASAPVAAPGISGEPRS